MLSFTNGEFRLDYHSGKKLAWWLVLELYTKCIFKGLYEGWNFFSWEKLLVDWKS